MIFARIGLFLLFLLVGVGEYFWISSEWSGSGFLVAFLHAVCALLLLPKLYAFGLTKFHADAYILYGVIVCITHLIKGEEPYRFSGGAVAILDLAMGLVILLNGSAAGEFVVMFLSKAGVIFLLPLAGIALLLI